MPGGARYLPSTVVVMVVVSTMFVEMNCHTDIFGDMVQVHDIILQLQLKPSTRKQTEGTKGCSFYNKLEIGADEGSAFKGVLVKVMCLRIVC